MLIVGILLVQIVFLSGFDVTSRRKNQNRLLVDVTDSYRIHRLSISTQSSVIGNDDDSYSSTVKQVSQYPNLHTPSFTSIKSKGMLRIRNASVVSR